jgi:hypothetical protein
LSGWGIARIEFDLNFSNGGEKNGPATKPFTIQAAIESVTSIPCLNAAVEFFTEQGPKSDIWKEGAPNSRYSIHFSALRSSEANMQFFLSKINFFNILVLILDTTVLGNGADGKLSQKFLFGTSS